MVLNRGLRCLQINLDIGRLAMDLIFQLIKEQGIHVVLEQEPFAAGRELIRDRWDDVFIWLAPDVVSESLHRDRGFVVAELEDVTLVFANFLPNKNTADFTAWLDWLGGCVRGRNGRKVLIAGNLNAKSGRFGSGKVNAYGGVLEEFLNAAELVPNNIEDE
ncbi:uncharacterized protein [Euwallacea fornicatus]|uniref:uncharacterized protein n=1 Tax=Euwallacea fornicatus TaxID=995702 RepID=UPI00338DCB62